jgi:hypothetical protein
MLTPEQLLRRAQEHVFTAGAGDVAEALCRENMAYGLAKIHWAQSHVGAHPDAIFVGAPDVTVTRNAQRWRQGFSYGGYVSWSGGLAILDSKPNGCGMLVSVPNQLPAERHVRARALDLLHSTPVLDGVPLVYDLGESNHFVIACDLVQALHDSPAIPPQITVVHSSGHEHRARSPFGPGLYYDESPALRATATELQTPFGSLSILRDDLADEYHAFCGRVQLFNARRRAFYADQLFGPCQTIFNGTHQGMRMAGCFHLGSYWFDDLTARFPLTLGPDQPVYLVEPMANYTVATMDSLGWLPRAERHGLTDRIANSNLLPHGGGYALPDYQRLLRVQADADDRRRFLLEDKRGRETWVEDIRALPFSFRGKEVVDAIARQRLGRCVAEYRIRYSLKEP